jgi:hypothetical protein
VSTTLASYQPCISKPPDPGDERGQHMKAETVKEGEWFKTGLDKEHYTSTLE